LHQWVPPGSKCFFPYIFCYYAPIHDLVLRPIQRRANQRRRAAKLDADDTLKLAEQLLIRHRTGSLDIRDLHVSLGLGDCWRTLSGQPNLRPEAWHSQRWPIPSVSCSFHRASSCRLWPERGPYRHCSDQLMCTWDYAITDIPQPRWRWAGNVFHRLFFRPRASRIPLADRKNR
jgi:hypothetical protein